MPRGKSGGARQGAPGRSYPNRSDLNNQKIQAAPGQEYGQAQAQLNAQRQVPLPQQVPSLTQPTVGTVPAPQQPQPGPAGAVGPQPQGVPSPGVLSIVPGQLGDLAGPTQRPNEPVHAGSPLGAGPGPEALQGPDPLVRAAAILNSIPEPDAATTRLRNQVTAALNNKAGA